MFGFCSANLRNIDNSLLLQWCFVDASLSEPWWKSDDLDANNNSRFCFFVLISESLIFHCCFIDDSLMRFWWTMESSMQTLLISKSFAVLVSQLLMFLWCFIEFLLTSLMSLQRNFDEILMFLIRSPMITSLFKVLVSKPFMFLYCVSDDSLMIFRRNIVETVKTSMQTVVMICLFEVQIFETLMFSYFFIDDSLMIPWWDLDEQWRFRCNLFWLVKNILCYSSKTLKLLCCLLVSSLMSLWRNFDETLMILMQTVLINFLFRLPIYGALLKILMC